MVRWGYANSGTQDPGNISSLLSAVEYKRRYLAKYSSCFFHNMEVNGGQCHCHYCLGELYILHLNIWQIPLSKVIIMLHSRYRLKILPVLAFPGNLTHSLDSTSTLLSELHEPFFFVVCLFLGDNR